MNNLYQKFHGMPGIGHIGETGEAGQNGHSIYFGFIKDFFDGVDIKHDARVKVAKRKPEKFSYDTAYGNNRYTDLMNKLWTTISKNFVDSSLKSDFMNYLYKNTSIYYSGLVYDENTKELFQQDGELANLLTYKFDIDTMPWKMAQMLSDINESKILNDTSQFSEINISNIKIKSGDATISYVDAYDYIESEDGDLLPGSNLSFDSIHVTYEAEDAAEEIGHLDEYMVNFDDASLYTILDESAQQLDGSTRKNYSYLREFINYPNDLYTSDTNDSFDRIIQSGSNIGQTHLFYDSAKKYTGMEATYIQPDVKHERAYTKNAIELQDSILIPDEFSINNGGHKLTYYGIDSDVLYKDKSQNVLNDRDSIIGHILNSSLYNTENDLIKATDEYLDRITMTLANNTLLQDKDHYIRWIADNDNIVNVPSKLSSDYVTGDIIYFYTDEQDYITSNKITNMVIITDDLVGCGIDTFLGASIKTDPFEIHYFNNILDRVRCTNKVITLYQPKVLGSKSAKNIDRFSFNSINNIIGSYNDSNLILANASNNKTSHYISIKGIDEDNISELSINANGSNGFIRADIMKFDSMLIPNTTYNSNVESLRGVYDKYIILDNNKFLSPITTVNEYITEDEKVYLGTKIYAESYIDTENVNLENYIYGYEVYNNFGSLIQTQVTNEDELQIYVGDLFPNSDMYDTEINTFTVLSEFSLQHTHKNNNLDWDGITFKYVKFALIEKYVYFVYESEVASSNSPYDKVNTIKILLSANDFSYYTYASEYINGKYYYDEIGGIIKSLNSVYQNDVIISSDKDIIMKNVDPYHSYFYINVFAANKNTGLKHYSKMSKIDYLVSVSNNYLSDYSCEVIGDSVDLIQEIKLGNIEFSTSDLSPEKTENASLIISPIYDGTKISQIYINHQAITMDNSIFSNSWMTLNLYNQDDNTYKFVFDLSSNIPNVYNIDSNKEYEGEPTINDYMISLCDEFDEETGLRSSDEAQLFQLLALNKKMPSTNDRYVLVSVEYTLADSSTTCVDNYNLQQPGFKDTRDIPNISINIHNRMDQVESYNTMDNGVLCNQFVTYMDINIDDFDSTWRKYLHKDDNDTKVSMDFEFVNINSDLDWTSKYTISNPATTRNTIKLIANSSTDASGYFTSDAINNYVALNAKFVNPSDNTDISFDFDTTITNTVKLQTNKSQSFQEDYDDTILISDEDSSISKQYILCSSTIMTTTNDPKYIFKGINDYIDISICGITSQMLQDTSTFRIKLEYEIGNPIISSLYLRFALKKVVIHYNIDSVDHTFTAEIPSVKTPGMSGYIYSLSSNDVETYKYISNTLNVMTNPISYVMCPNEYETYYTNMQGNVMKTGNPGKISRKIDFYSKDVYDMSNLLIQDSTTIREKLTYDWSPFRIKGSYLQDNIGKFNISYLDYNSVNYDDIHKLLISNNDPILLQKADTTESLSKSNYLNIIYNSAIMNPKLRDNYYTFYFNNVELEKNRYNQIENNCPIHATDNDATMLVRDQDLIDSMNAWNFEYLNGVKGKLDKTFVGNLNQYGNGYLYLSDDIDVGQYASEDLYSLELTKSYNNNYIYNSSMYDEITYEPYNDYEPEYDGYYRSFLYNLDWTYPYYSNSAVTSYQIVSDFDYLVKYLIMYGFDIDQQYIDKYDKLVNKYGDPDHSQMIPYSLLFELTPRIAYNVDNDTINVLMLRRPSIGNDTDSSTDFEQCYSLSNHYFELMDGQEIKKISSPYKLLS